MLSHLASYCCKWLIHACSSDHLSFFTAFTWRSTALLIRVHMSPASSRPPPLEIYLSFTQVLLFTCMTRFKKTKTNNKSDLIVLKLEPGPDPLSSDKCAVNQRIATENERWDKEMANGGIVFSLWPLAYSAFPNCEWTPAKPQSGAFNVSFSTLSYALNVSDHTLRRV